ncbi:hypothetical protein F5B17DRAFT_429057 [Nemania serpens]|nr:hypothetical protein F5B17DRAFT_429057 [Nemania serpens]
MAQTRRQAAAQTSRRATTRTRRRATAQRTPYPKATSYTFIDEMWRTQIACPTRLVVEMPCGGLKPVRPPGRPRHGFPHTAAQIAAAEDLELWATSSSPIEYENRKRNKRVELEAAARSQPTFHGFPLLPAEL